MKQLLAALLVMLLACSLEFAVYADTTEELALQTDSYSERLTEIIDRTGDYKGCTIGRSLPIVSYSLIKIPNLNFGGVKALSSRRIGLLIKDGEIIGEAEFNGDHLSMPANTDSEKLYNVLTAIDGDLMIVETYTDRYVVCAKEQEKLYLYTSFGKSTPPIEWTYTLSDYLLCYSYMNTREVEWTGDPAFMPVHYRPYEAIDAQVILDAKAYWEQNSVQEKASATPWILLAVAVLAVGVVTVIIVRRKKAAK